MDNSETIRTIEKKRWIEYKKRKEKYKAVRNMLTKYSLLHLYNINSGDIVLHPPGVKPG